MEKHADQFGQVGLYGGAASAVTFWGLNLSDIGIAVSAAVALAGFVLHVIMSIRRDSRERAVNTAVLEQLRAPTGQKTPTSLLDAVQQAQGPR